MALYKRGSTWWIDFATPRGERVRRSAQTGDKAAAKELHDRLKAEAWRIRQLGERPAFTWDDAGYRWLQETAHKRTHDDDVAKLAWLQQFLRGRVLASITREEIAVIGESKKAEASGATANRYLALVRAILRKAWLEWRWLDWVPKVKLYREAKRRVRWITPEQARVLLDELPEHQRDMMLFALATGLRQAPQETRSCVDGRLEVGRDGAALRALGASAYGASRGGRRRTAARHKYVTRGRRADCCGHKKRRHDYS
jgi:hypothetical protein